MKKSLTLSAAFLALVLCLTAALAAGGDAGDPLIPLSYLEGLFSQSADTAVDSRLDAADRALEDKIQGQLDALESPEYRELALTAREAMLKEGDVLSGATGLSILPLAGDVRLDLTAGAAVDVTEGRELTGSSLLTPGHRYIVAERSAADFTVTSPTAVVSYQGGCTLSSSPYTPDYFGIARALRDVGLFRGTGTGFGEGFDLHLTPNRGEGLVLFIRLLGEEDAALDCADAHPFTDVPGWLDRYVAWAYRQGYTNGVSSTKFAPAQPISAAEYEEFLLRALGYSVAGVDDYTTSITRALDLGAITLGEFAMLTGGDFLRAQAAYLSYYALDVPLSSSGQTLAQYLEGLQVFSPRQLEDARQQVGSFRLG